MSEFDDYDEDEYEVLSEDDLQLLEWARERMGSDAAAENLAAYFGRQLEGLQEMLGRPLSKTEIDNLADIALADPEGFNAVRDYHDGVEHGYVEGTDLANDDQRVALLAEMLDDGQAEAESDAGG